MKALPHPGDTVSNEQLGFAFLPELPTLMPAAKPARKRAVSKTAPACLPPPAAAPGDSRDMAAWASALEAHPDYRVLRRLKPTLDWPQPQGPTRTVLVLDTETTGLDASREQIIELALLRVTVDTSTGLPAGPVLVYDELEDPGKPIPAEVTALTGLRDADVRGHKLDESRIAAMVDGVDLVVAHNAGFDRPFVERRLPGFSKLPWACSFADIDWKAQGRGSAKLESLAQALGWFYDAHRAEMDCHALLAVLAAPMPPQTGLARLLQAAAAPGYRVSATLAPFDAKDALKARGYRWNAENKVWQIRVNDDAALEAECTWLKEHVYEQRSAHVQVETLDALTKYSSRNGRVAHARI